MGAFCSVSKLDVAVAGLLERGIPKAERVSTVACRTTRNWKRIERVETFDLAWLLKRSDSGRENPTDEHSDDGSDR